MSSATFWPYRAEDAAEVKRIIDEAFEIHRYVADARLLNSVLEVYLRERLLASTFTRVAVIRGRIVGLIMGRITGQVRLRRRVVNRVMIWTHMLNLALFGFKERESLRRYRAFSSVYRRLRGKTAAPLTDELTLFAVATDARGLGVGNALYRGFLNQLDTQDRTDFFLYTDSQCSYGFYEKHGMTRAAAEDMPVLLDGHPEVLGVYLYTGTNDPKETVSSGSV